MRRPWYGTIGTLLPLMSVVPCSEMARNASSRGIRNAVFALYEPALELPCCNVREPDVVVKRAKERYAGAYQDRSSSNGQFVDESRLQEPLDGLASVDVEVRRALGCQALEEVLWW